MAPVSQCHVSRDNELTDDSQATNWECEMRTDVCIGLLWLWVIILIWQENCGSQKVRSLESNGFSRIEVCDVKQSNTQTKRVSSFLRCLFLTSGNSSHPERI